MEKGPESALGDPDDSFVQAVVAGDTSAHVSLIKRYGGPVRRALKAMLWDADPLDVEEVENTIFMIMVENIERWDRNKGTFVKWIYGITRRQVWKHLENKKKQLPSVPFSQVGSGDEYFDPANPSVDHAFATETSARLMEAFERAKQELTSRELVVLKHVLEERPHVELSRSLETTEDGAKQSVYRLKTKLARLIQERIGAAKQ